MKEEGMWGMLRQEGKDEGRRRGGKNDDRRR